MVAISIIIIILAVLLGLVVLAQNPKGGGLAAGFTGASQIGGVQRTADFMEKSTWTLAGALMVLCLVSASLQGTTVASDRPLAAVPVEDGALLVVGSNFASPRHPAWTANLLAHPDATVTFRGRTYPVTARLLDDRERADRWDLLLEWFPNWRDYTEVTDREFRVFELRPVDA